MPKYNEQASWEEEILMRFDEAAKDYLFPMPDNYSLYNAGSRLNTFRNEEEWLVVFQMINYDKSHTFLNEITAYGNKIEDHGIIKSIEIMKPKHGQSFWSSDGKFILNKWNFEVVINETLKHFSPSEDIYHQAGVKTNSSSPNPVQILRVVTHLEGSQIFLQPEQLLDIYGRTDAKLNEFIELNEWNQPNIADDEMPSGSPCFISLAKALAQGKKEIYACPSAMINSHWSNWEMEDHRGWE